MELGRSLSRLVARRGELLSAGAAVFEGDLCAGSLELLGESIRAWLDVVAGGLVLDASWWLARILSCGSGRFRIWSEFGLNLCLV